MENKDNMQPLSIEQAHNFIAEKKEIAKKEIKKESNKTPISVAPYRDRMEYLRYAIGILDKVDMEIVRMFARAVNRTPEMYNGKEVAAMFKRILTLKLYGYTNKAIAHFIKEKEITVDSIERIAIRAVQNEIERRCLNALPLVGGNH